MRANRKESGTVAPGDEPTLTLLWFSLMTIGAWAVWMAFSSAP